MKAWVEAAENDGYWAYHRGWGLDRNPYHPETDRDRYEAFRRGWLVPWEREAA